MFEVRKMMCVALVAGVCAGQMVRAEERRIAVVNIAKVFESYAKVKDIQDKLKTEFDPTQQSLDADERAIRSKLMSMTNGGDTREKNDPSLFRDKQALELRKFEFESKVQKLYVDIEERRKKEMKSVLEDIKAAIGTVGRQENYDLVMRAPEFEADFDPTKADATKKEDKAGSATELVQKFRENPVLYFTAGVDITVKVIDILNANYKARGGK